MSNKTHFISLIAEKIPRVLGGICQEPWKKTKIYIFLTVTISQGVLLSRSDEKESRYFQENKENKSESRRKQKNTTLGRKDPNSR